METTGCSMLSFSPGTTLRLLTTPEIGATRLASRIPMRDVVSWACADFRLAAAASSLACEDCNAVGEMNFCSARLTLA